MNEQRNRPEWHPKNAGAEYASSVMPGSDNVKQVSNKVFKRRNPSINEFKEGISLGDTVLLSKAITLVESSNKEHQKTAQELLKEIFNLTGNSVRVGITGPPGAGKSTFIEALGMFLIKNNYLGFGKPHRRIIDEKCRRAGKKN